MQAPNGPSQTSLISDVITAAGIAARDVTFVAVHGTGTPLGDPIEVNALGQALAPLGARNAPRPATMGSVKSCFGHTEGAAGMTGTLIHTPSPSSKTLVQNFAEPLLACLCNV